MRQLACDGVLIRVAALGAGVSSVAFFKTGGRGYYTLVEVSELLGSCVLVRVTTLFTRVIGVSLRGAAGIYHGVLVLVLAPLLE